MGATRNPYLSLSVNPLLAVISQTSTHDCRQNINKQIKAKEIKKN